MTTDILKKQIYKKYVSRIAESSDAPQVPELLSPAGDPECANAAILCGADAVYLGLKEGSARAGAGNFTFPQLKEICNFAHSMHVKVYVALNILPFGAGEAERFAGNAKKAASEGADGVIVQDTGLLAMLLEMRNTGQLPPFFRVHASTQAGICSQGGIRALKNSGVDRVILPRELTLTEIADLKKGSDVELEVFVHGAMCMCYSGNCLLSSYIGGRSGNRGNCAQPCRMKYRFAEPVNGQGTGYGEILSPDDLCALPYIDRICAAGVDSLKIEGRLKSPEYTALTTRIYREALDAVSEGRFGEFVKNDLNDAIRCLQTLFTRSGGGPGFLLGNTGKKHMTELGPGRSGAYLGIASDIRREKYDVAKKAGLEFFRFTLGKKRYDLAPGDGVTLTDEHGNTAGGTVNKAGGDGSITVCGSFDPAIASSRSEVRVFQTLDAASMKEIKNILTAGRQNVRFPVKLRFSARPGEHAVLTAHDPYTGKEASVLSAEPVTEALSRPLSEDEITLRLAKLNDTCFYPSSVSVDICGNIFMPVSALNAMRRDVISELLLKTGGISEHDDIRVDANARFEASVRTVKPRLKRIINSLKLKGTVRSRYYFYASDYVSEKTEDHAYCDLIYVPWDTWNFAPLIARVREEAMKTGAMLIATLPLLPFKKTSGGFLKTLAAIAVDADGIQLTGTGDFGMLELFGIDTSGLLICADHSLNCTDPFTLRELGRMGADIVTLSPEYPDPAMAKDALPDTLVEIIDAGPVPLMRMRHCIIGHGDENCRRCTDAKTKMHKSFRIIDTNGSKYDILTLPDDDHNNPVSAGGTGTNSRFCENILLSTDGFEPKAAMQSGGLPFKAAADNIIIRTQILNGVEHYERKS